MEQSTNAKLVNWIREKVKTEYANDICIVVLYGSFTNGTANSKSDVDCYFIPKTKRACQFANDFIICGIGYDIFPVSWERAQNIADLKESLQPLIGDAKVIYYNSEEDLHRFLQLQVKLKDNLENAQLTYAVAIKKVGEAYDLYQHARNRKNLAAIRKSAGFIIMTLADAVAVYNHTYYHYGLKRQFSDLKNIPDIPNRICDEYLSVIRGKTAEDMLSHCFEMIQAVCCYMNRQIPVSHVNKNEEHKSGSTQINYASLAALYEEICSTFNKIYVCCENGDYVLAYLSAVCLQEDLDYAHNQLGAGSYDLLQSFDYSNLETLSITIKTVEKDFVDFIISGGGRIKRFDSFEEFEQAIR